MTIDVRKTKIIGVNRFLKFLLLVIMFTVYFFIMRALYYKNGGSNAPSPKPKYSENKKKYFKEKEERERKTAENRAKSKAK